VTARAIGSVLLAAGRGTRLRPLTDSIPKAALPLPGGPLGAYGLVSLQPVARPVVVNVSHLAEIVERALSPFVAPGAVEFVRETPLALGTAGTLAALRHRTAERVLTLNADVVTDLDPDALLTAHDELGATATVAVREVRSGADLVLSGDRAGTFIDRRITPAEPGARFLGMAVFARRALDLVGAKTPAGISESLLDPLIARDEVAVLRHEGYFADVGTPARYLVTAGELAEGRGPEPPVRVVEW
jgi:NDP-sugar pyrophosphorylase family protein